MVATTSTRQSCSSFSSNDHRAAGPVSTSAPALFTQNVHARPPLPGLLEQRVLLFLVAQIGQHDLRLAAACADFRRKGFGPLTVATRMDEHGRAGIR